MTLTFTSWFETLVTDLEGLASRLGIDKEHEPESWHSVRIMAKAASEIEYSPLFNGLSGKATIEAALKKIGLPYHDEESNTDRYLPDVTTPQELLFALIYYHHLKRFDHINQGSHFVLTSLQAQRSIIQRDTSVLLLRIKEYCAQNFKQIKAFFPELQTQNENILEQLEQLIAKKITLEEKLFCHFHADVVKTLERHKLDIESGNLVALFKKLDYKLKLKEENLREIASYKKLIGLINTNELSLDDLKNVDKLEQHFPGFIVKGWHDLEKAVPQFDLGHSAVVTLVRAPLYIAKNTGKFFNWAISQTFGRVAPQFINNYATSAVNAVSAFTDAITPEDLVEKRKMLLLHAAEVKISSLIEPLNASTEHLITAEDFKDKTAEDIMALADKVTLIRKMEQIQEAIALYKKENTSNPLVNLSLGIFDTLTELFSKSFFRPLIFDKVLLTLTARKMGTELNSLIRATKESETMDQTAAKCQFLSLLNNTKEESEDILRKSRYVLFKNESKEAKEKLTKVLDTALLESELDLEPGADATINVRFQGS